jgi:rubrerythrin
MDRSIHKNHNLSMKTFNSVDEILDFAMQAEQEAVDFYTRLAERMKSKQIQDIFLQFAQEEVGHKARLQKIKEEKIFDMDVGKVQDLKIADYLVSVQPSDDMEYAEALILAMKKEKAAFKLYTALSERTEVPELKQVFQALAVEESKHKLRFELEYDEFVMREN